MENTEENRLKLAEAVWETLSLDDIHEQFIFQALARYGADPNAFDDDVELMGLNDDEEGEHATCVHCDESHHVDADHQCKGGE